MAIFYIIAGVNHFINPEGYEKIIPPFFPAIEIINILSGIVEILLGILVFIPTTRKAACYGIIVMLIAFIPAHVYMIKTGFCAGEFCLPGWALWLRLLVLQPLLIFWAWKNSK